MSSPHCIVPWPRVQQGFQKTTSLREKERLAAEQCHTGGVSPVANYDTRAPQLTTHATQSSGAAVASIPPVSTTSGVEPAGTAPPAQMEQHAGTAEHSSADHQPPDTGAPHLDEHSSTASTWSSRGRRQGALQARVHAQLLVHFVRKVRARDDRRASRRGAQDETTSIELSDTSSETLVEDAGDSEWETDREDDRQQAVPSMPLTDAVKS
ncbi:hypothetical protein BD413DRAFT_35445 [Trametes elegans]|nr:hypothetical protein BD413DRAFT_35445 [Trametes elegans]